MTKDQCRYLGEMAVNCYVAADEKSPCFIRVIALRNLSRMARELKAYFMSLTMDDMADELKELENTFASRSSGEPAG